MECLKVLLYWVAELDDVSNLEIDIQFHSSMIVVNDRNERKHVLIEKLNLLQQASAESLGRAVPYDLFHNKSADIWTLRVNITFEKGAPASKR